MSRGVSCAKVALRRSGWATPQRFAQSDATRLRRIIDAYRRPLSHYLARIGVPSSEVDDAVQDAFLVLASKLASVPAEAERPFLFATALRVASNARRGYRRREHAFALLRLAPIDPLPTPIDRLDGVETHELLEDALDELPSDARVVFLLAELHDMPTARIAERLGLPAGTVASRLRRARQRVDAWRTRAALAAAFDDARPARPSRPPSSHSNGRPEVMSWWVRRGEVDALSALVGVYERAYAGAGVVRAAVAASPVTRDELRRRVSRGIPPDTFQVHGGSDLLGWVRRGPVRDRLEPIDGLFASEGWRRNFSGDVLDLVSAEGRLYAVPVDIHRTNALFYNRSLLAEHGLQPPSTLFEMYAVWDELRARGTLPFAFGHRDPWTLTMLAFENVLVALAGGDYYRDFFSGRRNPEDPEITTALLHLLRILDYANPDAGSLAWDGAVERVRTGGAAMTIMGDWAKGYVLNSGAGAEHDFGQAPTPGTRGTFIFVTDAFGLPRRASERESAIDLLRVFGSREGQDAFNPVKGSIAARTDTDLSRYDAMAREAACAFRTSARYASVASLTPSAFKRALDVAMAQFVRTRDPAVVIETLRAHYDWLAR